MTSLARWPIRRGPAVAVVVAIAAWLAPAPAAADLEWVPEGRFHVRYSLPLQGPARRGPDANFEVVSGRLGTRLLLAPGLSVRAVAELLPGDPSRRSGDLRIGYGEWVAGPLGTLRAGQVPLLADAEESLVGDPVLGPGVATAAGFFVPGGLGGSWERSFPLDFATTSVEVAGTWTEGYLGSAGMAPNPLFGMMGTGPALHGRAAFALPDGSAVHVLGRYGLVQDQQGAIAVTRPFWDLDTLLLAAASGSNPADLPVSIDLAAMARARYNLGHLLPALWRTDVVGRVQAVARNVTKTPTVHPLLPAQVSRTDLLSGLGVVYRMTDWTLVALDVAEDRTLAPEATSSVFVGLRAGVQF